MRYEIKYKIKYLAGWYTFPEIVIKYRSYGKIFWNKINQALDEFAHSSGFGNYDSATSTYWLSTEDRAEMFNKALNESYCHGSLDAYARSIVLKKVKTKMDNKNRQIESEALISEWVTSGWKSIMLDTNDQDEIKQHSLE